MSCTGLGLHVDTVVASGLVGSSFRPPLGGWNGAAEGCPADDERLELKCSTNPIACHPLDPSGL